MGPLRILSFLAGPHISIMSNEAMTPAERLETLIRVEQWVLNRKLAGFRRGFEMCESPIEQQFYLSWLEAYDDFEPGLTESGMFYLRTWIPGKGLDIYPQVSLDIDGQKYRVDFLICAPPRLKIVVELDGHDFHERTKQQASRDKSRDRAFARNRFIVLRFTGSEIFSDPGKAILEVQNTIARLAA